MANSHVEERKILGGFDGVPFQISKRVLRSNHLISKRSSSDVQGSDVKDAQVQSKFAKEWHLHSQRSTGESRVIVQARGDSMSLNDDGRNGDG